MTAPPRPSPPPMPPLRGPDAWRRKTPLRGLKGDLFPDGARNHHQVGQAIPGPAPEPTDPPLAEAGAEGDRAAQAQVFRFQSHGDTFMARTASTVKFPGVWKDGCLKGMRGARAEAIRKLFDFVRASACSGSRLKSATCAHPVPGWGVFQRFWAAF